MKIRDQNSKISFSFGRKVGTFLRTWKWIFPPGTEARWGGGRGASGAQVRAGVLAFTTHGFSGPLRARHAQGARTLREGSTQSRTAEAIALGQGGQRGWQQPQDTSQPGSYLGHRDRWTDSTAGHRGVGLGRLGEQKYSSLILFSVASIWRQ